MACWGESKNRWKQNEFPANVILSIHPYQREKPRPQLIVKNNMLLADVLEVHEEGLGQLLHRLEDDLARHTQPDDAPVGGKLLRVDQVVEQHERLEEELLDLSTVAKVLPQLQEVVLVHYFQQSHQTTHKASLEIDCT